MWHKELKNMNTNKLHKPRLVAKLLAEILIPIILSTMCHTDRREKPSDVLTEVVR